MLAFKPSLHTMHSVSLAIMVTLAVAQEQVCIGTFCADDGGLMQVNLMQSKFEFQKPSSTSNGDFSPAHEVRDLRKKQFATGDPRGLEGNLSLMSTGIVEVTSTKSEGNCGSEMEYPLKYVVETFGDIPNGPVCAALCRASKECYAWTYAWAVDGTGKWSLNSCYLMGIAAKDKAPIKSSTCVSGQPGSPQCKVARHPGETYTTFILLLTSDKTSGKVDTKNLESLLQDHIYPGKASVHVFKDMNTITFKLIQPNDQDLDSKEAKWIMQSELKLRDELRSIIEKHLDGPTVMRIKDDISKKRGQNCGHSCDISLFIKSVKLKGQKIVGTHLEFTVAVELDNQVLSYALWSKLRESFDVNCHLFRGCFLDILLQAWAKDLKGKAKSPDDPYFTDLIEWPVRLHGEPTLVHKVWVDVISRTSTPLNAPSEEDLGKIGENFLVKVQLQPGSISAHNEGELCKTCAQKMTDKIADMKNEKAFKLGTVAAKWWYQERCTLVDAGRKCLNPFTCKAAAPGWASAFEELGIQGCGACAGAQMLFKDNFCKSIDIDINMPVTVTT